MTRERRAAYELAIHLQGGLVSDVIASGPINYTVLDTDSDGVDPADLPTLADVPAILRDRLPPDLRKLLEDNAKAQQTTAKPEASTAATPDVPPACECDNTHAQNRTVCRWCWAQGRRFIGTKS